MMFKGQRSTSLWHHYVSCCYPTLLWPVFPFGPILSWWHWSWVLTLNCATDLLCCRDWTCVWRVHIWGNVATLQKHPYLQLCSPMWAHWFCWYRPSGDCPSTMWPGSPSVFTCILSVDRHECILVLGREHCDIWPHTHTHTRPYTCTHTS